MRGLIALAVLMLAASSAAAQQDFHVGAHFQDFMEFQKVVDARCTICHTGGRVQKAREERRDFEAIQERMLRHGALLSDRDKEVLGTFWGMPLREREGLSPEIAPLPAQAVPE